jgi:hypothetical protein
MIPTGRTAWSAILLGLVLASTSVTSDVHARTNVPYLSRVQSLCPTGPPGAVVRAYYAAAAQHRRAAVRACFAPSVAAVMVGGNGMYVPWNNTISARVTAMRQRVVSVSYLGRRGGTTYTAVHLVQILVSVVVRYRHLADTPLHNGPNDLFIYVAQQRIGSPWRIVAIGTGP